MGRVIVVVGGQKSGKSTTAARRAAATARPVVVVAPAVAGDAEMAERIARHRADRPASWRTVESFDLLATLAEAGPGTTVVVDALDTWLEHAMRTRGLLVEDDVAPLGAAGIDAAEAVLAELDRFCDHALSRAGTTIVVAGELGSALAPIGAGARRYVDLHGRALQRLAAAATEALLVVAGRAVPLPPPEPAPPGTAGPSIGSVAELVATVTPVDDGAADRARRHHDALAKPRGSLGRLEALGAQLAAVAGHCPPPRPARPALLVACGDHGVHDQGVTPWPQAVTGAVVRAVCDGVAASGALAEQVGATVTVLDVGVRAELAPHGALRDARVRSGTRDLTVEPAMTPAEAVAAMLAGARAAADLVGAGADLLVLGEVGMANTTPSAALVAALTGARPADVTGRGTGIDDATYARKVAAVQRALARHADTSAPLELLACLGGLEHAALVGACLGGAALRVPVVLDGVTTDAAALVAAALAPAVAGYLVAGHASTEPGARRALDHLGLDPLLDLGLRLGEGSGALLAVPLVQAAARVLGGTALLTDLEGPAG